MGTIIYGTGRAKPKWGRGIKRSRKPRYARTRQMKGGRTKGQKGGFLPFLLPAAKIIAGAAAPALFNKTLKIFR